MKGAGADPGNSGGATMGDLKCTEGAPQTRICMRRVGWGRVKAHGKVQGWSTGKLIVQVIVRAANQVQSESEVNSKCRCQH